MLAYTQMVLKLHIYQFFLVFWVFIKGKVLVCNEKRQNSIFNTVDMKYKVIFTGCALLTRDLSGKMICRLINYNLMKQIDRFVTIYVFKIHYSCFSRIHT